jgi:hypothetical protein
MQLPDKQAALDALLAQMKDTMAQLAGVAEQTRAEATHEEAKPENDKDTRALEQSYLARGQAMRVEELMEQIQVLRFFPLPSFGPDDPIEPGALVGLEAVERCAGATRPTQQERCAGATRPTQREGTRCLFLLPHGGGAEVRVGGAQVQVVTPASPMGRAILGRSVGDAIELRVRGALREYEVVALR